MRELAGRPRRALDVGCGEGRFVRVLAELGAWVVGLDPTHALLEHGATMAPHGPFVRAKGEALPFASESFDLVVTYLSLIDILDFRTAIAEMARVLEIGGTLLVANLAPHATTGEGWVKDSVGKRVYFPIDRYMEEFGQWVEWRGVRVVNYHRPLSAYMAAFLGAGLHLRAFNEPLALPGAPDEDVYRRVPWAQVMVWGKG